MARTPRPDDDRLDVAELLRTAARVEPAEADPVAAVLRRHASTPQQPRRRPRRTAAVAGVGLLAVAAGTALVVAAVDARTRTEASVSAPADVVDPSEPIPAETLSPEVVLGCTQVGNSEGVSVDLTTALPLEGGDYFATVSVPSLGASSTRGFAGNDEYGLAGGTAADLTSAPVEVRVRVVTERGDVAYERSVVVTPQLFQPNGAACDGENYDARLVATASGDLVQLDDDAVWREPRDAQGRNSLPISTGCGVLRAHLDGVDYHRTGGVLDDGAGGPPPGWNAPYQRGWVSVDGDVLTFQDERGHTEEFQRTSERDVLPPCG